MSPAVFVDANVLVYARQASEPVKQPLAAQLQNCSILLSEDLQDRAVFGSVVVRRPFTLGVSDTPAVYATIPDVTRPYRPRGRPRRAGA